MDARYISVVGWVPRGRVLMPQLVAPVCWLHSQLVHFVIGCILRRHQHKPRTDRLDCMSCHAGGNAVASLLRRALGELHEREGLAVRPEDSAF